MLPSDPDHLLKSLLVGGSLGALIGLERQWDEQFRHHTAKVLAGLRTFSLWALFGVLCAWFSESVHPLFFVAGFAVIAVWLTLLLQRHNRAGGDPGFTTGAAGMVTFLTGGLVFWGMERVALVLAVSVMILLAMKPALHRFTRGITMEDVRSALKFAAVTGVILPLVPDEAMGPYGAFNPHTVWMMVVLVSGVAFVGYLAVRVLGQRNGIALAGVLGGIASSTATTLAMSRQSRERPSEFRDCALAILLACTVMVWRVAILVGAVSTTALQAIWPSLLIISLPGLLWCVWRLLHGGSGAAKTGDLSHYGNPLRLRVAFQFAALYAVIILAVKASIASLGNSGVLILSGLSGLIDLDAITLSLSQMTLSGSLAQVTAIRGILLAIVANTVIKALFAGFYGSPAVRREVFAVLGVTALAALAASRFLVGHY
ncbi:MAG: MgtC/SapB family protein [Chthoniobacterales bacterium]